jgi:hypothetical protein
MGALWLDVARKWVPRFLQWLREIRTHYSRTKPICNPLPKNRPRALTIYNGSWSRQNESALLRLPVEIRLMIYEALLGRRKIHLSFEPCKKVSSRSKSRLVKPENQYIMTHNVCQEGHGVHCWQYSFAECTNHQYNRKTARCAEVREQIDALGLLRTCHQV